VDKARIESFVAIGGDGRATIYVGKFFVGKSTEHLFNFLAAVDGACAAATTHLKAIMDSKSKWPDPKPDFRKPLIDALAEIDTVLKKVM